jgi:hypothetical protein
MLRRTSTIFARQSNVRNFSGVGDAGTGWKKMDHAREEQYFNEINAQQRKAFSEKLHAKELRELLAILGPENTLPQEKIHKLLEWKHDI